MLQLPTHDGAVMMNHGDGCHDDQILQLCEDATVLVVDQHGHHQPMHVPSQELRDQVMSSLAHDPSTTGPCHGTEEGIDQGGEAPTDGSLRLLQNPVSGSAGSADDGRPMFWASQGGQTGARLQVGVQPVCNMGGMRELSPSDVLHPRIRGDGGHPQSRSLGQGHGTGDLQAAGQRAAGQQPPEEREDLPWTAPRPVSFESWRTCRRRRPSGSKAKSQKAMLRDLRQIQTVAAKAKATVTSVERKTRRAEDTAEAHQSAVIAVEDQETEDWTTIPTG